MLGREKAAVCLMPECPLCGASNTRAQFEKAGQHYRHCPACQLVFASSATNANLRSAMSEYEPAYRQYLDGGPADAANFEALVHWIEKYTDLNDSGIRLLDVGAGSGKFLRHLHATRSCRTSGLEPSAALFEQYGLAALDVEPVSIADLADRGEAYDVITVLDVIEHIADAGAFVRALGRITRPGSLVFLSTPDAGGPLARLLGRRWHHFNPYHFCLYRRQTLAGAARIGGFAVVEAGHAARRMSLDYLWNYAMNFGLGARSTAARSAAGVTIPVNVFDVLSTVWRRA
jgi:2-polyprenyl-3-methyl-5-hydroxy-6-metoxy-1,4-benzoquinol methylase